MSKTYRPYKPEQLLLLPPSVKDWLPAGHLAHFVSDIIDSINLTAITCVYEKEERGYPPYHPVMMTKVLVYAYCSGAASSRKIARRLLEDVAFRMLAAGNTPDFRTISDFRKTHLKALVGLFVQVLRMCQKAGLVKLGHIALDGTKIKANASKHKAMSYERMNKEEAKLKAEVEGLLRQAQETDELEDAEYGIDKRGDELPVELAFRESRLKKIQEAKEALEREALEEAETKKREEQVLEKERRWADSKTKDSVPTPEPKAQKNFTDPESRIMPSSGDKRSFIQGYNCQAAVDDKEQIIVAADVTQQTNDKKQAEPMLEQVIINTGAAPKKASMDSGYFSKENVIKAEKIGTEVFMPPDRQEHGKTIPAAPRGRIPGSLSIADRMRRKLQTKRGRNIYAKRKETVEPVFGQIKQGRGFRQFLLRGKDKVRSEWLLICMTHNLLKLWRAVGTVPVYAVT
jgi:transposase